MRGVLQAKDATSAEYNRINGHLQKKPPEFSLKLTVYGCKLIKLRVSKKLKLFLLTYDVNFSINFFSIYRNV